MLETGGILINEFEFVRLLFSFWRGYVSFMNNIHERIYWVPCGNALRVHQALWSIQGSQLLILVSLLFCIGTGSEISFWQYPCHVGQGNRCDLGRTNSWSQGSEDEGFSKCRGALGGLQSQLWMTRGLQGCVSTFFSQGSLRKSRCEWALVL